MPVVRSRRASSSLIELYFSAYNEAAGTELWKSDETTSGAEIVKDINVNGNSNPAAFACSKGSCAFGYGWNGGVELWKTDGTADGTVMLKNINQNGSSYPSLFTIFEDAMYFRADDGVHGDRIVENRWLK